MTKSGSKKMRAYVLIETAPGKTKAVKKELVAIQGSDSTVANLDAVTGPFGSGFASTNRDALSSLIARRRPTFI